MHATNAGDPTRTNRHAKTKTASNPEGQRTDKTIRPIKGRGDSGNPSASTGKTLFFTEGGGRKPKGKSQEKRPLVVRDHPNGNPKRKNLKRQALKAPSAC